MSEDRYQRGMRTRRAVLGDVHVDKAEAGKNGFDAEFQKFIAEGAWGTVWAGDAITRRERSLVTIALLAALGHHEELAMHIRASRNTGATVADIREVLLHVAVYAGVPAANRAFATAKQTFAELNIEV
ncbi:4-carboxymuconolactone decarboxylase [Shumkonia mesophila]|uniref:4-carboxymuconolactone decarboxylase n=1 Tax=Shumkonia mesophila TaxID=2838854 RepID=UPI002934E903|nr:4-carboxymuconolactone decarboxylase [Shumkonia mesophila]